MKKNNKTKKVTVKLQLPRLFGNKIDKDVADRQAGLLGEIGYVLGVIIGLCEGYILFKND